MFAAGGGRTTDTVFDWQPGLNGCYYNCVEGQEAVFWEGTGPYPNNTHFSGYGNPSWGSWVQWEAHLKNNTPVADNNPGTITNSIYELYKNGVLFSSLNPGNNINGTLNMNTADLQIGGVYTYYTYWLTTTQTPPNCNSGNDFTHASELGYNDWTVANPCPSQSPSRSFNGISNPAGFGPIFNRITDDIIILKK